MIQVSPLSSISFDHDWKLDFQEQVDYYQKFKPGDAPRVQYADDVTSALKPFLDINGTVTELQPTTLATTDSIVVKEVVLNLTSIDECTMVEFYFAESQSGTKSLSTVFMVNPDLEGTVLVEYTHRRDEFDTVFNTANKFCFRVEGCFLPQERQFDSDTENFRDQRYKPKTLSAFPIEKKTLSMGGGYGVPYWVARLINKIFCLSNVYVNGERMVRSDGGVEITVLHNDYPLYIYKVELESSEDEDVVDILSLLRVVDSKKKVARSTGDDVRVYNAFAKEIGISDSKMIRELSTIEEIAGNFYIELDDNVSSNTGKATLEVLQQFIFNGWIDQSVRKSDNVQFNSVTSSKGNWSVDELGNIVGKLVTLTGMQTDNFAAGMTGTGVGIVNKAEVHADKVLVRKYLEVLALVVAQMFYRGGRQVLSPAGMKVSKVVEGDTYYRLYMETDEGQVNEFTVGAQARVNRYGAEQRYWWRLVTGMGTDYIDVSKTDMDSGSAVPSVGDEVVQFGHRTDPYLQWVVMDSSFSDDAGTTIYAGVDSYDLSGKMVLRLGVDPGDPGRIGLFLRNGSEISEEITRIDTEIGNVSEVTDSLNEELTETRNTLNNLIQQTIPDLQNQIDGAIQSWDGSEEPTLENYPANEWTTDTEKARHVGDTYYQNTGDGLYTWKFIKNDDGTYGWQKVADSDTAALEQDIRELAGIVGTKNSIHYTDNVPTPPYIINDIWIKTDGTMYTCIAQRDEGQVGGVSDWEVFNDTMIRLAAMASDSVISKEEKAVLRDTWAQVQKEYATYQSQASAYGVDITGLTNAYNSLNSYLTGTVKINENTDTSLSVSQKSDYNTRWANWNSETTEFANAVAEKMADEAVGGIDIGIVNLLKDSDVELGNEGYQVGSYKMTDATVSGEEYTVVCCYTLGEGNSLGFYTNPNYKQDAIFSTKGSRVVEAKTFTEVNGGSVGYFYQYPHNGPYGSKVHWAVLVRGNKAPTYWFPSPEDSKMGVENLVSFKRMLEWNDKNSGIAVWGQDGDGVYLGIEQKLLYEYITGKTSYNDIFLGEGNYKSNTQYVLSIEWKMAGAQEYTGLSLYIVYTDGTYTGIAIDKSQTKLKRTDFVTDKGKTVKKIYSSYGTNTYRTLIYALSLIEGNVIPLEIPTSSEDEWRSEVNLVDGGEEVTVTAAESNNYVYNSLVVPMLKPNTVYTVKVEDIEVLAGSPSGFTVSLYSKGVSTEYAEVVLSLESKSGLLITTNNFTAGEARLLLYAGKYSATAGNSVKYTGVSLVEGFYPPQGWTPSQGDYENEIAEVGEALNSFKETVETTFKDGIINEGEANAIASNINMLNAEKSDVDAQYTQLYANTYLTGTAKTNLQSAKSAYDNAHTALLGAINTAISDDKITDAERADVDAKFTAYGNALGTYQTRVEEANKAIQDTIKQVGDDAQKAADNAQQTANEAKSAAQAAQDAADAAQGVADSAQERLNQWAEDDVISPAEKQGLKDEIARIDGDKSEIVANYTKYGLGTPTAYNTAHANYRSSLVALSASSPETISIPANFATRQTAYYTARTNALTAIASAAKEAADNAQQAADSANTAAGNAQQTANSALAAAQAAQDAADAAQSDANDAHEELNKIVSDSVISPVEKTALKQQQADMQSEYNEIIADAGRYGVSTTAYTTAYNSANAALTKYTAASPEYINIESDYNNIAAYYPERQSVLNSIAAAAKQAAQDAADAAKDEANGYTDEKIDDIKTGFINLVSFKHMLSWNEKNSNIAVWGQDDDGVYLGITPMLLYNYVSEKTQYNDCFLGEGNYKAGTQYVLSIEFKNAKSASSSGLYFYAVYTDGTSERIFAAKANDTTLTRQDFTTQKGKTIQKIYGSYGLSIVCQIYSLSLVEGNTPPVEIPTAEEDIWRSEVNLVDGGEEVTVTAAESNNYVYNSLVVPMLKPNTVYTVKVEDIEVLAGSPSGFTVSLYSKGVSTEYAEVVLSLESKSGLLITTNNFTAGEARLLLYAGKYSATAGNSVKYTGISLVEGFYPPRGWTPSQGDTRAEIEATGTETKDSFAQKLGYDSYADMKNSLSQGMITTTGMLNAKLIETEALVVTQGFVDNLTTNQAFISKLDGWTFDFHSGKVGGFTIANNKLYAGADFGSGAGVYMQSLANNYGFRAYKDSSNYVEMFYRTASDWGLKGLAGGSTVFQLGSTNKIGPFVFGENNLTAESVYDSRALVLELTNNIISFKHAMGTIYQKEVYFGAVPDDITYGTHTLLAVVGGDIYHQGTVGEDGRRSCRFYTSDMYLRNPRYHRQLIGGDWHYVCYPTQSGRFSFTPNSDGSGEVQINIVETTTEYAVIGSFESQNETVDSRDRFNFCIRRKTSTYFILSYKEIRYTRVYFSYIIAPIYPS